MHSTKDRARASRTVSLSGSTPPGLKVSDSPQDPNSRRSCVRQSRSTETDRPTPRGPNDVLQAPEEGAVALRGQASVDLDGRQHLDGTRSLYQASLRP